MSATERLRALLRAENVEYGQLGEYMTYVASCGLPWALKDNYNDTISASIYRLTPEEAAALVCGNTAEMLVVSDEDGVGHSECRKCGRTVGQHFRHCPWCGAKFTKIRREYRE